MMNRLEHEKIRTTAPVSSSKKKDIHDHESYDVDLLEEVDIAKITV